ncbi:hypothetical protein QN277_002124 [Acacia crassicarpa]|uniref:Uncharacterized protein n=1 Tax=Acacia crassicarpa TaxID=499986 RepID=A0AAE1TJ67_9FABA|nr:hypothetical protein QN277_002124 [Acacia crassicarpa]
MPYCDVGTNQATDDAHLNNEIKIFYRTYGHGPTKVLLIIGLAGMHDSWGPRIKGLTGTVLPNEDGSSDVDWSSADHGCRDDNESAGGIEVCACDDRGMGRSPVPTKKSAYT